MGTRLIRCAGFCAAVLALGSMQGCQTSAEPQTPPAPAEVPVASATPPPAAEPAPAPAPRCDKPAADFVVVARARYKDDITLLLGGAVTGQGKGADPFDKLAGKLLWLHGACIAQSFAVGDLSRSLGEDGKSPVATLERKVEPLPKEEQSFDGVAFRTAPAPGGGLWLLAQWNVERRWGLDERFMLPLLMRNGRLSAGRVVQEGRDAMGGSAYYSTIVVEDNGLRLTRHGVGERRDGVTVRVKGDRVIAEVFERDPLPPVAPTDRDGRDPRHAGQVCGAKGALAFIRAQKCPDGSTPTLGQVRGNAGHSGADGAFVEVYQRVCGNERSSIYVEQSHCP